MLAGPLNSFAIGPLLVCASQAHVTTIMTLDVRDFSRYGLPDGREFEIL